MGKNYQKFILVKIKLGVSDFGGSVFQNITMFLFLFFLFFWDHLNNMPVARQWVNVVMERTTVSCLRIRPRT